MNVLSEQEKRLGIASELADIEMRQRAIVQWNPTIRGLLHKDERETLEKIAREDEKNLQTIAAAMTSFGLRVEPKAFAKGFTELVAQRLSDASAPVVEKLGAYALAKQNQAMCGYLVHKSAQLAQPDVKEALGLMEAVQSSMEKQVAQVSSLVEKAGVRLIMGEEPADGLAGRVRDAASTIAGAVINTFGKPVDEMSVLNVLRMDHAKVKTLLHEIEIAALPLEKNDLFYQLRIDLLSHSEAEEQIVYRYFQQYDDIKEQFEESWSEHEQLRTALDVLNNLEPASPGFMARLKDLREIVQEHVDREENEIFKLINAKADDAELVRLAHDFNERKAKVQEQLSPHIASSHANNSQSLSPPMM